MKEITIGRDGQTGKLRLTVGKQTSTFGEAGSVPRSVSQEHARLAIGDDGSPVLMIRCPNPACGAKLRVRFDTGETVIAQKKTVGTVPGYLTWGGQSYELREGRNSVGRGSSKHEADVEIDTDDRSVSRVHCLLEAIRLKSGRVKVVVSDLRTAEKIAQKPTLVYDEPLAAEDRLVLEDGDTIEIGDQTLRFHQKPLEP